MGIFDHAAISPSHIVVAANIARAAYKGELLPDGWTPLDSTVLGISAGSFDGYHYNSDPSAPGGSAIVLRRGDQVAISFRGTDDDNDRAAHSTLVDNSYIDRFSPLLEAVAAYIKDPANGVAQTLVTGHSLGAAAANILRDVASDRYGQVFETADYVTFGTPKVAASENILNIGFENDGVFKVVARNDSTPGEDFASTTTTLSSSMTPMRTLHGPEPHLIT